MPPGSGFNEVFGVLVLAKGEFGLDTKDATAARFEQGQHFAAVLAIVDSGNLLPDRAIFDLLSGALEDHRFVGFFGTDHAVRISGNVLGLARARSGAEPEST